MVRLCFYISKLVTCVQQVQHVSGASSAVQHFAGFIFFHFIILFYLSMISFSFSWTETLASLLHCCIRIRYLYNVWQHYFVSISLHMIASNKLVRFTRSYVYKCTCTCTCMSRYFLQNTEMDKEKIHSLTIVIGWRNRWMRHYTIYVVRCTQYGENLYTLGTSTLLILCTRLIYVHVHSTM